MLRRSSSSTAPPPYSAGHEGLVRASSFSPRAGSTTGSDSSDSGLSQFTDDGAVFGAIAENHAVPGTSHETTSPYDPPRPSQDPRKEGHDRMTRFFDQASPIHHSLTSLRSQFDQIRALSARLTVLHPNDLSLPFLALELRDHLRTASKLVVDVDEHIKVVWHYVRDTKAQAKLGVIELEQEQLFEIQEETDEMVERFLGRVKKIKREAKGERRDRKEAEEGKRPRALDDWLACDGIEQVSRLVRKDSVPASRYVVQNPFTILARMTDGMESLSIPKLIHDSKTELPSGQATFDNPPSAATPSRLSFIKPRQRAASRWHRTSRHELDHVTHAIEEGWHHLRIEMGRESGERWLIGALIALSVVAFCAWILSRVVSHNEFQFDAVAPTMMNVGPTSVILR